MIYSRLIFVVISFSLTFLPQAILHAASIKPIFCPDASSLSVVFEKNWSAKNQKYSSYVNIKLIENIDTRGILYSKIATYPKDKNPHLRFDKIKVEEIKHYALWNIQCLYTILNDEINGPSSKIISMTAEISDYDYDCSVNDNSSVICLPKQSRVI